MSIYSQIIKPIHNETKAKIPNIIQTQNNRKKSNNQLLEQEEDTISNVLSMTTQLSTKRKKIQKKVEEF